jgi:hypothetical protein
LSDDVTFYISYKYHIFRHEGRWVSWPDKQRVEEAGLGIPNGMQKLEEEVGEHEERKGTVVIPKW